MSGPRYDPHEGTLDEATPHEVSTAGIPAPSFGLHDSEWSEKEWLQLLTTLIRSGIGSWKDVTALVLGHLNPSQVGTSLASSEGFKRKYGKGNTMQIVIDWVYQQSGRCADCGSRLELQADHIRGRENYEDLLDADFIENMTLRCRRCNVVRRPSHTFGGLTFLTTEAALMWILLVLRPRTLLDYKRMCRIYGMTMADIRMDEAWAMAHWLSRDEPPAFGIEDDKGSVYDLLIWPDSAITRTDVGSSSPEEATKLYGGVQGNAHLGFVSPQADGRVKFYEYPIDFIPFSTYDLGTRVPQSLSIRYLPPDRKNSLPQRLVPLPPRGSTLTCHALALPGQKYRLSSTDGAQGTELEFKGGSTMGKLLAITIRPSGSRLDVV